MSEPKTKVNDGDVNEFLNAVADEQKRADSFVLLEMFKKVTGQPPKMWGSSMVGFDQYHYKSERSSQEGDWLMTGFSPRKQNLTLYVVNELDDYSDLLSKLGKHKTSVGCLYINKLQDVDRSVLEDLINRSYQAMKANFS
jgi:hypothetical protein